MSAHLARRFLRPRYVFFASGFVWVVDESQPVAALFDPFTAGFQKLVSWQELPSAPPGSGPPAEIVRVDTGLWVQTHAAGPLVHVNPDGIDRAEYGEGHRLTCAGSTGAWCFDHRRRRPDVASTPDVPPRMVVRKPTFLVAVPGGGTQRVHVDAAAVASVDFDETSLYVGIEHDPWTRVPTGDASGRRAGFEVRYSTSVLRVPLHTGIPQQIDRGTVPSAPDRTAGYTSEYADVTYNENHRRKRAFDGELRWNWGKSPTADGVTVVRLSKAGESARQSEIELPGVRVAAGAAGAGRLWLVATSDARPGERRSVLVVGTRGEVGLLQVDDIDITDRCRPVGPPPLDHDAYVQYCLRGLDRMQFSDTVDDVNATYEGAWPTGSIHVRFRHRDYSNLTLVARLKLYDEEGTRLDNFLAHVYPLLGERAETRAFPPASDAVDGVLYV